MEVPFPANQLSPLHYFLASPGLFSNQIVPENYVSWTETPEAHVYSADLPGVRKEEIKVEVEDSRYLIIRTEGINDSKKPAMNFMRKFRLPGSVDIDGISAKYEDGVLTVTVPRSFGRGGFYIDPADVPDRVEVLARAA
ncbi:15.4 kDa class V heat shock protein [Hibiscus syriacus]|uniref:15.4 kDa class V heat shock protein n=1 Tax=Hibiscus syriacus TaxID=106335 RepID=A0A6A3A7W6_HIBSY|nr:15.4 kDa class V heat shock protein-like [Hibiscus syriacus]KAE8700471.1 15.4 kDa class V heat shock protein [Hibiscus syriacus]